MTDNNIKEQIVDLINTVKGLNLKEEDYDEHLFSSKIDLSPRDLVYVFLKIEELFKIQIPEENIINEDFITINKITEIVSSVR